MRNELSNPKDIHSALRTQQASLALGVPRSVKSESNDQAPDGKANTGKKIDDIVVPQIDRREDQPTDDGEENIEKEFLVAVG